MTDTLHFTYKSPANLVRLCTTILFEQDEEALKEHGYAWKKLLDTDKGEELFLQWMTKVLPEGGMIGEDELYRIKELAIDYLETDADALTMCRYDLEGSFSFNAVPEETLKAALTVDAKEVVHAHWEKEYCGIPKHIWEKYYRIRCSHCHGHTEWEYPFCMHCGAIMDEVINNE